MAPLQALVEISARLIVSGKRSSRRTIAHSTGERWSTFVFARQGGTRCDRAGRLLIGAIFTVFFAIAELRLGDTFGRTIGTAVWTKKLIVRTSDRRTVRLVTLIGAVVIAVTMEVRRNAESVFTSKLAIMTGGEVCEKKMRDEIEIVMAIKYNRYDLLHAASSELSPQSFLWLHFNDESMQRCPLAHRN